MYLILFLFLFYCEVAYLKNVLEIYILFYFEGNTNYNELIKKFENEKWSV